MSMSAALSNVGGGLHVFRRQQDRLQSERVADADEEEIAAAEEGSFVNTTNNNNTNASSAEDTIDLEEGHTDPAIEGDEEEEATESDVEEEEEAVNRYPARQTVTLAELEEERELARRRSSACVLFALFVLFRLWVLALQDGDFGLLLLCVVGSSWTARWIRYNREQEEELDRRIADYLNNNENANEVGRDDLRMLSFQAQLALAIMESQRQMMQGGYGHPDEDGNRTPGVSEEAKAKWEKFSYKASRDKKASKRGSYGSVAQDDLKASSQEEEPHCSICLGEYEENEELSKLPCSHIYHDECISSWCSNHTRCPLCNYDLQSAGEETA